MIFLTLGTHQPFDRLVEAVDAWCAQNPGVEVFGQVPFEKKSYRPVHFETATHLHIDEYRRLFASSRFVVAHAGMGSIITALSFCRPIVLFPRRAALQEQRNDHQLATVNRFRGKSGVHVAEDRDELFTVMTKLDAAVSPAGSPADGRTPADPNLSQFAEARFVEALRAAILPAQRAG